MKNLKNKIMCNFVTALLVVSALRADAQKGEFGLRFMPTVSSFDMKTSDGNTVSGTLTIGYGIGALGGFNFNEHVGIQVEAIYISMAQKYKEDAIEREVTLRYLNFPLLLSLNTGKTKPVNFNAVIGPQLGISTGSDVNVSGDGDGTTTTHAILAVKTSDIGFAYGVGVDFGLNASQKFRLGIGFRGVYGLFDISDKSQSLTNDDFYVLDRAHVKTYSGYIGASLLF